MIVMSNRWLWFLGAVAVFLLLVISLQPILMPFLVAALFAYLMDPVADKLEEKKLSRTASVSVVFFVMSIVGSLLALLIVPLLGKQLISFIYKLPDYVAWLQGHLLPYLNSTFGIHIDAVPIDEMKSLLKENWQQAGSIATHVVKSATASTMSVVTWVANIIIIPVVSFYLLRDWDKLMEKIRGVLPRPWKDLTIKLAQECDEVLSAFIRGQFLVMTALGAIYTVGLSIIGLDLALFLGTLAGFASVVPYLGAIVGISTATIFAYLQFHEIMPVIYVLMVFGFGQMLEGMVLTPLMVGDKIGLHPVAVIFAIMAGGQLAGFVGILIALPVAAVLMVFLRHLHYEYKTSEIYLDDEEVMANEEVQDVQIEDAESVDE